MDARSLLLVTTMREEKEGRELMNKYEWLAEQFEANRVHLQAVAYRMLGSTLGGRRRRTGVVASPQSLRYERH